MIVILSKIKRFTQLESQRDIRKMKMDTKHIQMESYKTFCIADSQ
uniref:Uncharacterized protein n=1 Tax=Anguilla anguilla TaxID=7936 RepID=A0A0E9Q1E5_ANGAN